jgi:SAM-dependent methyltransferase
MPKFNPTNRFSDRVENYVKFRPAYPEEIYAYLRAEAGLGIDDTIMDLGSGTGLLSKHFLKHGHKVFGVEPNSDMRKAGEHILASKKKFVSLDGRAEGIPLPDQSIDYVVAGQAFHWFEPLDSRIEVKRVLVPDGEVALIWNEWDRKLSPFLEEYEALLLKFGTDFEKVRRSSNSEVSIRKFFNPIQPQFAQFPNRQDFDFEALRGRLLSSSYAPLEDHPDFKAMIDSLQGIFARHNKEGLVRFDYRTTIYHAKMNG